MGRSKEVQYPRSLSRVVLPGEASQSGNYVTCYFIVLRDDHWLLKVTVNLDPNRLVEWQRRRAD